ncbi:proline dehydrogenase 1, mitochondrial-like isoform X1 [Entelurus aequoreus]|uniref:proline dehydrogenase 1, mitochondrial-like isoform X1 n=1 Tax=Entelurus aequoreus TaxID=161455 RepID=UPI002B1DFABB|nr:proline dehydrogenase 1, mitochondrial-like isoform X1 [Entelurus aequoreus]
MQIQIPEQVLTRDKNSQATYAWVLLRAVQPEPCPTPYTSQTLLMLPAAAAARARAQALLWRTLSSRRPRPAAASQAHTQVDVGGDGTGRTGEGIRVDFEQTREAYKSKDSLEILRSLLVLKMCSYDFLVDKNEELKQTEIPRLVSENVSKRSFHPVSFQIPFFTQRLGWWHLSTIQKNPAFLRGVEIMDFGKKVLGQKAFDQLMKMTFYGQFVAGEDHKAIKPLIRKNLAFGVGSVLDYSVEEDISQGDAQQTPMHSSASGPQTGGKGNDYSEEFGESHTYFHADESKCDQHMETFIKCIQASGGSSMDGFSAIKMTALGRPQFLLQFSELLVKWRRFFHFLASKQGGDGADVLEQRLDLTQLQDFLNRLGERGDVCNAFAAGRDASGSIDLLDWNSLLDDRANLSEMLLVPNVQLGKLEPLLKDFAAEEEGQMRRILQRMDVLAKHAVENGVRLMVDAEQTYLQPAISRLTLEMQKVYNKDKPVIFNTYQCYLKEAYDNVTLDVELSRREGWHFAAKLVRGAYMHQERKRALELGYEDPINPDYESTNTMYHRCLDYVLDEIALNRNANVMVASHNENTVKHTLMRMNTLALLPSDNKVFFGQLLGMCDQISFPLGQAGFPVYKYVPYGPVSEVMPYLTRRAQENRGFMKGAQKERDLLWKELKRRLACGELLYRPLY